MSNRKLSGRFQLFSFIGGIVLLLVVLLLQYHLVNPHNLPLNKIKFSNDVMFFQGGILGLILIVFGVLSYLIYFIQKKYERYVDEENRVKAENKIRMENMTAFVNEIAAGNFEAQLLLDKSDNDLAGTLVSMKNKLQAAAEDDRQRNWTSQGLAELGSILRIQTDNIQKLYNTIINFIIKYTKSNQGSLYIIKNEDDDKFLELVSCYAYDKQKFISKKIRLGEGLVGQSVLEKETIYLTQIPDNFVHITSGLGDANPRALLIVPLKINDEIFGVLELASFNKYPPYQVQFIEKLGESIASTISSVRISERTTLLLQASQESAEELRAQEEEMRQNMEELQATQEEMKRKEQELAKLLEHSNASERQLAAKLNEIEKLKEENQRESQKMLDLLEKNRKDVIGMLNKFPGNIFLKDSKGYMVLCNEALAKLCGRTVEGMIGSHDTDFHSPEAAKGFFDEEQEIIKTGARTVVHQEALSGKLRFHETTKMPFYINHLDQIGLLGFQIEITKVIEAEKLEKELKEEVERLKAEIENLRSKM